MASGASPKSTGTAKAVIPAPSANLPSSLSSHRLRLSDQSKNPSSHLSTKGDRFCRAECLIRPRAVTITLRGAIISVLAVALCIGLYLLWLWRPEHQVRLHTEHFFHAINGRNWESVAEFIGEDYRDQWDHDRTRLVERMREGFRWARASRITAPEAAVQVETPRAIWIGKIN